MCSGDEPRLPTSPRGKKGGQRNRVWLRCCASLLQGSTRRRRDGHGRLRTARGRKTKTKGRESPRKGCFGGLDEIALREVEGVGEVAVGATRAGRCLLARFLLPQQVPSKHKEQAQPATAAGAWTLPQCT